MGSTRVGVLLSADERNIARLNTSETPNSLYVPNQGSQDFSPIKVGKSLNAFWTIPNGTFPAVGSPRWWNYGRCSNSTGTSTVAVTTNAWMHPLQTARTAQLLGVAVNATTISATTSTLYAVIYQFNTSGYFSQVHAQVLTAGTTTTGLRIVPMNYPLVAGTQYALSFGGTGFTVTTFTENGPPKMYPTAGTYDPSSSVAYQAWQSASLYIPYISGQAAQNISSFYWQDLNMQNGIAMIACSLQLRTL